MAKEAPMGVPKAPVYKNYFSTRRKDDVRRAGQVLAMQSKAIAERMKQPSNRQFRRSVLSSDAGHQIAAAPWSTIVCHGSGSFPFT
jgi:hypothetical protein